MQFVEEQIQGFKVNIKLEKKSKLSSVVLRMRGIDQVAAICCPFLFLLFFFPFSPANFLD